MTKVSTIIFSMLIFSMVLIGVGTFYSDLGTSYNVTSNNMSSYSQKTFISGMATTSETALNESEGGLSSVEFSDLGDMFFSAPINILKSFLSSTNALINTFVSLEDVGMPMWVVEFVLIAIPLIVSIAVINALWKKEL